LFGFKPRKSAGKRRHGPRLNRNTLFGFAAPGKRIDDGLVFAPEGWSAGKLPADTTD
jgi:hypothetical protein